MATLFIFAGLPASGKTALARRLARHLRASYLRIDTIEQALREVCGLHVEGEGYRVSYRIAENNLRLGMDVVADSCNPLEMTRREWEQVARDAEASFVNIEVVCSDRDEHRRRVESRVSDIPGLRMPTWSDIESREYQPWTLDRIVIDTAGRSELQCFQTLLAEPWLGRRAG